MLFKITKDKNDCDDFSFNEDEPLKIPFFRLSKTHSMMKTDILENNEGYKIIIDMPGFEKEDIKLTTDNDYLEVTAVRKTTEADIYLHQERFFGECYRKFYVGDGDKKRIKAIYKQGVLDLWVPKVKDDSKATFIEID